MGDKKDIFKSFRMDLNSRTKSRRRRAYHQNEVLYITKAKALYIIIAKEIQPAADDIHLR